MSFRFQFRRGTTAERDASNPILAAGEPAVVLDSGQPAELVLGDGVTPMAGLRAAVWDDDARLTDDRDPSAHTHLLADVTDAGTAAAADVGDFATTAQGAKADAAVQPAAVTDAIVSTVGGGRPSLLVGATLTAGGTVLPVDVIGAKVYGADGATLKSSTDDGATWATACTLPHQPIRLLPTDDGEVLSVASGYIHKSSGWSTNPATATWALKVDGNATAGFYAFSVDGDGSKFIASEYSGTRADSRYVHISTDSGASWSVVWDTVAQYPATHAESHVHGCCYDPWEDRFWFTEGHGEPRGFYYSEDDGTTWVKLTGPNTDMAALPTVLVATNDGIVCGTDDAPNGLLGIRRGGFAVEIAYQYWKPRTGAYGFAERGFRDPRTGLVYIGWRSEYAEVSAFILAGSATAGGLVWDSGVPAVSSRVTNLLVTATGALVASYYDATIPDTVILSGRVGIVGSPNANAGNSAGGTSTDGRSVAVGPSAATGISTESTAIGYSALAQGTLDTAIGKGASTVAAAGQATAIGAAATTGATLATAIGASASASMVASTAVGANALSSGANSAAIGASASATQTQTTAVGRSAKAQVGADATAIGYNAVASGSLSTAVGASATASNTRSLALGQGSTSAHVSSVAFLGTSTVADNQVQFGARHLEIKESATAPAAASVDSVRLFARDNGSGKTQLCARFNTGAVVVIATEP